MYLVLGPPEAEHPMTRTAKWVAWARGPNGERADGGGDTPEQALSDLANKLERIRPDPNG